MQIVPGIERRIDGILACLSLEEKILLLGGQPEPKQGGDTFGNAKAGTSPTMAGGPRRKLASCRTRVPPRRVAVTGARARGEES